MVLLVQNPWRSGWPSGVRAGFQAFVVVDAFVGAGVWEKT
jgi:hypothetical protein